LSEKISEGGKTWMKKEQFKIQLVCTAVNVFDA